MKYWIFALCFPLIAFSWATQDTFKNRCTNVFVETGSHEGHGIITARMAGFREIHSIELSEKYYQHCKREFAPYPDVHCWQGDSGVVLAEVIRNIHQPITFWLDAHFSGNDTAKGETNTPILRELEIIKNHPIKSHVIFIDDVRLFGDAEFDSISLNQVINKLHEINPRYRISFTKGYCANDILVAQE